MNWIIGFSVVALTIAFFTLIYFNKVHSIRSNAPSFLVTLGILFMFMGVGLGLYDFDLRSNPTKAIENLLIHIRGAFIASTIGVFYSILYKAIFYFVKNDQKNDDALEARISVFLNNNEKSLLIQQRQEVESKDYKDTLVKYIEELVTSNADTLAIQRKQETEFKNYKDILVSSIVSLQESNEKFITSQTERNNEIFISALKAVMLEFNKDMGNQFASNFPKLNKTLENVISWQNSYSEEIKNNQATLKQINESYLEQQKQFDLLKNYTESFIQMNKGLQLSSEELDNQINIIDAKVEQLAVLGKESIVDAEKYRIQMDAIYNQFNQSNLDLIENMKTYQQNSLDMAKSFEQVIEVNNLFKNNSIDIYEKNVEYSKKVYLNQTDLIEKVGVHQMAAIDKFKNKVDKQLYEVHMDITQKFEMTNDHLNKIDSLIENQHALIKNIQFPKFDKQLLDLQSDISKKIEMTNNHINKIDMKIENQHSLIKNIQEPKALPISISLGGN